METSSTERKVEVHYAWKLDLFVADISFTLKDAASEGWAEVAVFGVKKSTAEEVG